MTLFAFSKLVPPSFIAEDAGLSNPLSFIFSPGEAFIFRLINFLLSFLGIVTLVAIIFGGYLILTAGANEENMTKGKKVLTGAVLGFLMVVISYAVVNTLTLMNSPFS